MTQVKLKSRKSKLGVLYVLCLKTKRDLEQLMWQAQVYAQVRRETSSAKMSFKDKYLEHGLFTVAREDFAEPLMA